MRVLVTGVCFIGTQPSIPFLEKGQDVTAGECSPEPKPSAFHQVK